MLKVLHVNFSDLNGGAAIGVNRLHQALIKKGVNSSILVAEKSSNDSNVIGPSNTIEILITQLKISLSRFIKRKLIKTTNVETFSFNFFNTNILKKINKFNAEIVHIHWIGNEMISVSQLKKINKPVIWTFWDMWPICGAEHHSYDTRFVEGYTKNNRPNQESLFDLNRLVWNYKKKHLNFKLHIISLSKWMTKKIEKSFLFSHQKITYLPLHINTDKWKKRDKNFSRDIFNQDQNKKILLFGSSTSTSHRKGFDFLFELFKQKKFENCKLIIFGEKPKNLNDLNIDYEYIGRIKDGYSLSILYSAADVMLVPSKIEVFGQVGLEANSCGTPCVIFEDTGPTDYTEHKKNGYISKYLDIEDYAKGINWIIEDEKRYEELSNNCIDNIKKNFNDDLIVDKFIQKYQDLIKK
jgi:glycosyltransferase involved in cell wall biosynthesis